MTVPPLELTDLDRRLWRDELDGFIPRRVFDVHTHLYSWAHNLDPHKNDSAWGTMIAASWPEATWELAHQVDAVLMPGRDVRRLSFPFPFPHPCDFTAANAFLAEQLQHAPTSAGLMLVHPGTTVEEAEVTLNRSGFLGFKPYRFYAASGDAVNCRIADFMPEHLIALADRRGLLIMLHISKRDAIADAENRRDLLDLCAKYPRAKWILAHCARSYSAWAIEAAASDLRGLPNVWYDVSSVCESDAIDALISNIGLDRVMYGSDDIPVGVLRGKYIAFGRAWAFLSESNHQLNLSHCDPRMTFTRYEQLRAMRSACRRLRLSDTEIEALFHDTAATLIQTVRATGTTSIAP